MLINVTKKEIMSDPRRHHYVPQVYLRNFCITGEPEKIFVYDKINHSSFKSDIKNIAVEKDFYKVTDKDDLYYWEHFYSKEYESKYPGTINRINSKCILGINKADILDVSIKEELASMICVQLLRTKKSMDNQLMTGKKVVHEELGEIKASLRNLITPQQKEWLEAYKITDELIKEIEFSIINDKERLGRFIRCLYNRCWLIYFNQIANYLPFITSDHPVCYYNMESKSTGFRDNGLNVQSTVIFFPITSKVLLALYPKRILGGQLKKMDGQLSIINEERFINNINAIQLKQCYRQVYGSNEVAIESALYYVDKSFV